MSDLISRQQAIDALGKAPEYKVRIIKTYAEGRNDQWFDDVTKLSLLPSAQPQRMRGKWERHYCEDGNPDGWRCDNCDEWYYFGQTLPNFCPNCGADMRGEQDG